MSLFEKIVSAATGGIGKLAFEVAEKYFPPNMSEAEREKVLIDFQKMEDARTREADNAALMAEKAHTERVSILEGSASDLKSMPILGPLVLFLRGCQRPAWGFATLYLDWLWFSSWNLTDRQETALIVINSLVLGFLFGERAVRNVSPMIAEVFRARIGGAGNGKPI
ncbi:hypothetical protein MO867_18495 [Microbulbifer sp. OS29]|uniref:Holin of 3TMs, for gene-transfer release n=1 Tax=Microbulbifer okhotskensis TaxID=2926617 RepID=A0A9X2ER61_9GAMM|nr:hypothetical protein [Microbulbifer okhotskensis]MCO1336326.1 hypothetical protein [Microbulbifer okhotskensis]